MEHEKDSKIKIHGNAIVIILKRAYDNGGPTEAIIVAKQCVEGFTDTQILKIARGEAIVTGSTETGIEYKEL